MKFQSALVFLTALSATSTTSAFQPPVPSASTAKLTRQTSLFLSQDDHQSASTTTKKNPLASLALAGTIFAATLATSTATVAPAYADVELSTGAVIIQTSTKQGQSILKAEVDAKDLLGSLIKNRKALKESVGRIAAVVKEELASPVWLEVSKEILQIEGDVAPELMVSPPRDIQQTVKDVSKGKLNLIINGEIINLSIDKFSTSDSQDEIVIRAKGVKGVSMPSFNEPAVTQVRTRLEDQIDAFNEFWYSPLPLPAAIQDQLPEGAQLETGTALLGGSVALVGGAYGLSYAYYLSEQEAAAEKAEAQRKMVAERKKKAAAIAAKKKAEEEAGN